MYDVLVLGSGVAGLSAAVRARALGVSVCVLTKAELDWSATLYAQGGVAAALAEPDSPALHEADTLAAGAGLCDRDAVDVLVHEGPARVRDLMALGAVFDRTGDGEAAALALGREGGHSLARVLHAGGDATGAEIERALVAATRATGAEIRERCFTTDLLVEEGRCVGVRALDANHAVVDVRARNIILATGGAGQLFAVTTNPTVSTGDGIAMALRAGALIADVEFMQFHPTALHHPTAPKPLLSEALRGVGAVLRDERGVAFMADEHPLADLAPRDVVARAISARLRARGLDHLFLDARGIEDFEHRFPTIWTSCRSVGLDPTRDLLPVAPAAHYLSGGVATDLDGATSLPGLWACGEAACSGVHGANRLASNSLLDGLVFGPRAIEAIGRGKTQADRTGVLAAAPAVDFEPVPVGESPFTDTAAARARLQQAMTDDAGVLRDADSLDRVAKVLREMRGPRRGVEETPRTPPAGEVPARDELRNLIDVGTTLVEAARAREESRGTHTRLDFPERVPAGLGRRFFSGAASEFAGLPVPEEIR